MPSLAERARRVMTHAQYARSHGVPRKTVEAWQARGLLVLSYDGRIDVDASDARLEEQAESDYRHRCAAWQAPGRVTT